MAKGGKNGNRQAAAASHGDPDPSPDISPGTVNAGSAGTLTAADITRAVQALKAAGAAAGLNYPAGLGGQMFGAGAAAGLNYPAGLGGQMFGAAMLAGLNYPAGLGGQMFGAAMLAGSQPPAALERRGVSVGEFVGWRIWLVRRLDRLLESYSMNRVWLPGEPMEGRPSDCGAEGVWAFKEEFAAAQKAQTGRTNTRQDFAVGSVWLWGEIVEHETGWRAEFAEIRSLEWVGHAIIPMAPGPDATPRASQMLYAPTRSDGLRLPMPLTDEVFLAALRERYHLPEPPR